METYEIMVINGPPPICIRPLVTRYIYIVHYTPKVSSYIVYYTIIQRLIVNGRLPSATIITVLWRRCYPEIRSPWLQTNINWSREGPSTLLSGDHLWLPENYLSKPAPMMRTYASIRSYAHSFGGRTLIAYGKLYFMRCICHFNIL